MHGESQILPFGKMKCFDLLFLSLTMGMLACNPLEHAPYTRVEGQLVWVDSEEPVTKGGGHYCGSISIE